MGKNRIWRYEALGWFGAACMISLYLAVIGGWIANIFKLIAMAGDPAISAMFALRVLGAVVIPLGSILGFL